LTASRDGVLTVEAQSAGQAELQFNIYNQQDQLIGTATGQGSIRIDANVSVGEELTIEVINQGGEQSFDLTVPPIKSRPILMVSNFNGPTTRLKRSLSAVTRAAMRSI